MQAQTGVCDVEELWRLTMEHSPVGMALVAPDGQMLAANAALSTMLGHETGQLVLHNASDLIHPDDVAADVEWVTRALSGEVSSSCAPRRCLRADGSILYGTVSAVLMRSPAGEPIHFIVQIVDQTELRPVAELSDAAEQAAHQLLLQARAILETVSVGLLLVDAEGTYSWWNRRQEELLAIAFPSGHLGRAGQSGFVYDAEQGQALSFDGFPCARATAGEEFDDLLIWVGEEPATRRALSVSARTVRDLTGTISGAALAYNDVTEMVRAVTVKDEFVSMVSHELRTPLTSALAYLELLDDSVAPDGDVHREVAGARRNIIRLSRLVGDLIFSTREMSGSEVIYPHPVDLVTVVGEAVDAASVTAAGARIELVCEHPDSLMMIADGIRLRHVVDNLLANAIAYGRDGRVLVTLADADDRIVLTVTDEGDGIDPAELGQVFTRFFRGTSARRRQVPGAGLGLSIVRTIVEAHDGEVSAESSPGEGTTVRVVLPR